MRRLLPPPMGEIDLLAAYRDDERRPPPGRPWVAVNMVASVDGAVAVEGRSGGLSSAADRALFHELRALADVILVGAGTVRAERYGPPRTSPDDQERRAARGQQRFPRLAVVSASLDLDPTTALFTDTPTRPLVLTTANSPGDRRARLAEVADVIVAGATTFEPAAALATLAEQGVTLVVGEGGPTLNGALLSADAVDELCLTLAPLLASGHASRVAHGLALDPPLELRLDRLVEEGGVLFARYLRDR